MIAHVVRLYGGLTEPFVEQRVAASGAGGILWFEGAIKSPPEGSRHVNGGPIQASSLGDRLFHRIPQLGILQMREYADAEAADLPAVIHAHYTTTGYLVGIQTRSPLVVSAYGFDVSVMPRRLLWRRAFRALARRASMVLVEGPHMRETVTTIGFEHAKTAIVPISVDVDRIAYRAPATREGPLRLLSVGRLVEKKGHDTAIAAFALLSPELPEDSSLDIVGAGPEQQRLERLADSFRLSGRVRFHGPMAHAAYLERLQSSDMLIAASRTATNGDSEGGAPTTVLDAQASGVPVVASNHADLPYLVQDGVTGFLAEGTGTSAISSAIRRAVAASAHWPQVTAWAREQVEHRHSPGALKARLEAIYDAVTR